jgi:hypothetical protein
VSAPDDPHLDLTKLAYEEASKSQAQRFAELESLRSRAGLLISSAAVSTAFLGSVALKQGHWSFWTALATLLFVAVGASAVYILWPRDWWFSVDANKFINEYVDDEPLSLSDTYRDMAIHLQNANDNQNTPRIDDVVLALRIGAAALTLEVAAWLFDLATR